LQKLKTIYICVGSQYYFMGLTLAKGSRLATWGTKIWISTDLASTFSYHHTSNRVNFNWERPYRSNFLFFV